MGLVLDVYWHFSEPGDHSLGRVLANLDPNEPTFVVIPPHFNMEGDPMVNQDIVEAMKSIYSLIIKKWCGTDRDPKGVLFKCLLV